MATKSKRTFGDWFLILLGLALACVFGLAALGKVGLIDDPFPPVAQQADAPRFNNKECLNRNAYRIRQNDPMISDDMLSSDVARACVNERREFEGW